NIIIDEADGITLANVLTDDGDIIITASNGDIGVFYVRAEGLDGDITLIANSGSIIMNGSLTAFDDILLNAGNSIYGSGLVSGDLLTATAPNGISLNTSINTLTASTTNSNISITEVNGLSLNDVNAGTGDVTLTLLAGTLASNAGTKITGDDLVVNGVGAVNINTNVNTLSARTDNSNISIREINNPGDSGLGLNLVDAGTGNVEIQVLYGAITDNNGNNLNIIGKDLILSAQTGIGSGDALETQVSNLAARVTSGTATGRIEIINTGDLTLDDLAGWGYAVRNAGSGYIIITVNSNLTIDDPVISNGGNITLTANSGAIIQNSAGDITTNGGNYRAIASGPYIMADGAIVNSGSGIIDIDAGGDITLGQLISSSTVYLNSGGAIIDGGDTGGEDIQAAAVELVAVNGIGNTNAIDTKVAVLSASNTTGPVNINETDDLIIAGVGPTLGITTTGNINLSVGGNLVIDTNSDLSSNGGTITITANHVSQNNNGDIISSGGNINMTIASLTQNESSKIDAGNGNVTINATGDITLDEIKGNTVNISTTNGSIAETTETPDITDITATNLILSAKNGIGVTNAIETQITNLTATNNTSGSINISNIGNLIVKEVNNGNRPVILSATGSITNDDAGVSDITAGDLTLTAATGIDLDTNVNTLNAQVTGTGNITIDEVSGIDLRSVSTANGDITIKATTGDITLSGLVRGNNGSVYLYALGGSIIDNNTTGYDIIAGKTSGLYAGNGTIGIKSGAGWFDPLEVNINGDLYVYASDEYNLVSVAIDGIVNPRDMLSTRSDWGVPPGLIIFNGRVNGGGESGRWFRATGNAIHYIGIEPYIYETLMLYIIDPSYFEPAPEYWDLQQFKKAIEGMALK
ncbi:MAG: hypothetical protein NDF58_08875, partial [archaeon YNP-LCB-024-027]|nr:hypothetical protein [Candidatus Culexarchaeum yellowstonense]